MGPDGKLRIEIQHEHQVTSYDLTYPPLWGYTAERDLLALAAAPWVAGEFVWTGFDYIGEPTPYPWPSRSSYFGIVDLCGFPKDRYFIYRSRWRPEPLVHLLPHWTWPGWEGKPIPVWVVTNCNAVELFLNGKSLGEKKLDAKKSLHVEWTVPYAPGTLKALGKKNGRVVADDVVRTAGKPKRLTLAADRSRIAADGDDLAFVTVAGGRCGRVGLPQRRTTCSFPSSRPGADRGPRQRRPDRPRTLPRRAAQSLPRAGTCSGAGGPDAGRITLRAEADALEPAEIVLETAASP